MRKIWMGVCLVAMVSALGVSAVAASAHTFESTGGATRGKQIGKEEFVVWPMRVTCNASTSKGTAPAGAFSTYTVEEKFGQCTTFGGGVKVTVTNALWEYSAEETVALANEITITPGSGLGCKYTIAPQATFAKQSVLYGDEKLPATTKFPEGQLKLNIYSTVRGMAYTATGWPCTGPKSAEALKEQKTETSEGEAGSFVGASHEEVYSPIGSLTWVE
jgi:hypothetical protein